MLRWEPRIWLKVPVVYNLNLRGWLNFGKFEFGDDSLICWRYELWNTLRSGIVLTIGKMLLHSRIVFEVSWVMLLFGVWLGGVTASHTGSNATPPSRTWESIHHLSRTFDLHMQKRHSVWLLLSLRYWGHSLGTARCGSQSPVYVQPETPLIGLRWRLDMQGIYLTAPFCWLKAARLTRR
jgi:hypothetical protein